MSKLVMISVQYMIEKVMIKTPGERSFTITAYPRPTYPRPTYSRPTYPRPTYPRPDPIRSAHRAWTIRPKLV